MFLRHLLLSHSEAEHCNKRHDNKLCFTQQVGNKPDRAGQETSTDSIVNGRPEAFLAEAMVFLLKHLTEILRYSSLAKLC